MLIGKCLFCKKEFKYHAYKNKKYCTRQCYFRMGEQKRTFTCTGCGITFQIKKQDKKDAKNPFCTRECFGRWQTLENNYSWKGVKSEAECLVCKREFVIRHTRDKNRKTCSRSCLSTYYKLYGHPKKQEIYDNCHFCSQKIEIKKNKIGKRNFCNRDCADKAHSLYISGQSNGRYVHGNNDYPYPKEWNKRLKENVRKLDNYKCCLCGLTEEKHKKRLCVHHIDYDKNNLKIENLITMCKWCHGKMHGNLKSREKWKEKLLKLLDLRNVT